MPFIQNVSLMDIPDGFHKTPTNGGVLIQILDNDAANFPTPAFKFDEIHQFKFLDIEENVVPIDPAMKFSDAQAVQIAKILTDALKTNKDVIVHCHAGVCRSGAVCEVGVMIGFDDTGRFRAPNLLVKKKLMNALGIGYDY